MVLILAHLNCNTVCTTFGHTVFKKTFVNTSSVACQNIMIIYIILTTLRLLGAKLNVAGRIWPQSTQCTSPLYKL